ncbi:hypothetical protein Nepgr_015889 [Nepenthes gracilis]|uniref:Uncharacterized protein n=1 Tax=Nepenthes gracilis TaxID=150966 RepID=A0AAD3SMJ0_NEPGR|nr:hypothetical protein Nepgr_015889 [Nepenthes gracilis]
MLTWRVWPSLGSADVDCYWACCRLPMPDLACGGCRFGLRLDGLTDVDSFADLVLSAGMRISTGDWQCGFGKLIRLDRRLAGDWFGFAD